MKLFEVALTPRNQLITLSEQLRVSLLALSEGDAEVSVEETVEQLAALIEQLESGSGQYAKSFEFSTNVLKSIASKLQMHKNRLATTRDPQERMRREQEIDAAAKLLDRVNVLIGAGANGGE